MLELEKWQNEVEVQWSNSPDFAVDTNKLRHLAIVCDGNRRAAIARDLNPYYGHTIGVEVIKGIAQVSRHWGIKVLSFWVWSTENWDRNNEQVEFVMELAQKHLSQDTFLQELIKGGIKFKHIGRKDRLPESVNRTLNQLEGSTDNLNDYYLNLCLNYGGLDEMARGIARMFEAHKRGNFDSSVLMNNPRSIYEFLDTAGQPFPDLIIRTGSEKGELPHTSGFMPLQTTYAAWDFIQDLFPELTPEILLHSITNFESYNRRFGQ